MLVKATNKYTGEVFELDIKNIQEAIDVWRTAQEYEKMAKDLREQVKPYIRRSADEDGNVETNDYRFTVRDIQRYSYNKQMVRQLIADDDTFELFTKVDSRALNDWLKQSVDEGTLERGKGTLIRSAVEPDGKAYEVIKLEKLVRSAK